MRIIKLQLIPFVVVKAIIMIVKKLVMAILERYIVLFIGLPKIFA